MTDIDDWDDQDEDDDYYDYDDNPQDDYEPDPEDSEIARAYEEYAEHCDQVHGSGQCDCRPSLAERLREAATSKVSAVLNAWYRLTATARQPVTVRVGPAEVTVRLRADRKCLACSGRGWFYTLTSRPEHPVPAGYNSAALCSCGAAIGRLAETRRYLRTARSEPPF